MKRDKRPAFYFRPISSKSTLAKEKAGEIQRARRKGGEEEKMAALIVFMLATLEIFGRKNKLLDGRGLFGGKVFKNPARGIYFPSNGLP